MTFLSLLSVFIVLVSSTIAIVIQYMFLDFVVVSVVITTAAIVVILVL